MSVPNDVRAEMFRRMLRIRLFEEAAMRHSTLGNIPGAIHSSIGQEASIVGSCMALSRGDYMVGTHRSHGHPIAMDAAVDRLFAELMGKVTGINQGKGGSMHLSDFSVGSLGETSIVGSGFPVAVGAALASQMKRDGRVTLCFFGDGASNEGTFHESLNMASLWQLPVVFLCENNGYGEMTATRDAMTVDHVSDRAVAYRMPATVVDGQDVLAVYDAVVDAVARARSGGGPSMVETMTYRYGNHAFALAVEHYRSTEEIDQWRARDPVNLFRDRLLEDGVFDAAEVKQAEEQETGTVARAVQFALDSPYPDPSEAYTHLFTDPVPVAR